MKTYNDLIKWLEALSPEQLEETVRIIPWGDNHDVWDNALYWLDFAGCRDRLSFEVAEQGIYYKNEYNSEEDESTNKIIFVDDSKEEREISVEEMLETSILEEEVVYPLVHSGMPYIKLEKLSESKLD